jgi:hypothetical protein
MNINSSDGVILIEGADPPSSWVGTLCVLLVLLIFADIAWEHRHVTYATDYWEVIRGKHGGYWVSAWANKLNAIMLAIFITVLLAADVLARFRPNRLSVEVHPDHILFQRQGWLPYHRLWHAPNLPGFMVQTATAKGVVTTRLYLVAPPRENWLLGTISGVGQDQLAADLIKAHPAQPQPFGWKQLALLLLIILVPALLLGPHLVAAPH